MKELIQQLVKSLNIEPAQAEGGAGLLFQLAKDKLSGDDFSKVAEAMPDVEGLISAAPTKTGIMGFISNLIPGLGGSKLSGLVGLVGNFEKLGLDAGMISKFVPIVLTFVKSQGGEQLEGLLKTVFK